VAVCSLICESRYIEEQGCEVVTATRTRQQRGTKRSAARTAERKTQREEPGDYAYVEQDGEYVEEEGEYIEEDGDYVEEDGDYVKEDGDYVEKGVTIATKTNADGADGEYVSTLGEARRRQRNAPPTTPYRCVSGGCIRRCGQAAL
jgi:hypothetical protein